MKRIMLLVIMLAACGTPPTAVSYTPNPQAAALMATAQTVAAQETAVAVSATAAAYSATAAAKSAQDATATTDAVNVTATAQNIALRATGQALDAQATMSAIAAIATGTAVAQVADVERRLIEDEAARLAIQRQAERETLRRAAILNSLLPGVIIALAVVLTVVAIIAVWRWWQISQPVRDGSGVVIALPANQYQRLAATPRALPALSPGAETAVAAPQPVALPRLVDGHVLIVGVTGEGKTMALREIVEHRAGQVVVLDPHYTPGAWGDARVVGGGRNFEAIQEYMNWMDTELTRRAQHRNDGGLHFETITVATEEMPSIVSGGGRNVVDIWQRWMREGRKFNLYMVVVSQSTRVRTLGIEGEGDLLENFRHVLLLGKAAVGQYPGLAGGMERPAVLRSGHGAPQPVIIPYDPRRDPDAAQFRPLLDSRERGMATEGGFVTEQEIAEMLRMAGQGYSRRRISRELYNGIDGGAQFARVKAVLDAHSIAVDG